MWGVGGWGGGACARVSDGLGVCVERVCVRESRGARGGGEMPASTLAPFATTPPPPHPPLSHAGGSGEDEDLGDHDEL